MNEPGLIDHLFAFLIGIVFPLQSLIQDMLRKSGELEPSIEFSTRQKLALYKANNRSQWILTIALLAYWLLMDRSFESIGLQMPDWKYQHFVIGLSAVFVLAYSYDVLAQLFSPEAKRASREEWAKRTSFLPANGREFRAFLLVVVTAAICEEILFRGYLINYLAYFFSPTTTGWMWAIGIPSVLFAVSHLYQGWASVAKIGLLSLVFGSILVLTGSLLIPMILHFIVNFVGGWLSVAILSKKEKEPKP